MARLTFWNGKRWAYLLNGIECTGKIADKLARYEALGEPDEVMPKAQQDDFDKLDAAIDKMDFPEHYKLIFKWIASMTKAEKAKRETRQRVRWEAD